MEGNIRLKWVNHFHANVLFQKTFGFLTLSIGTEMRQREKS